MKMLAVLFLSLLTACSLSLNDAEAKREQFIKLDGYYYSYYKQRMWDAVLMFVLKTDHKPAKYIKSMHGDIEIGEEFVVKRKTVTESWKADRFLKEDNGVVYFCDVVDCESVSR